jgi:hypothetical protein
MFAISPNPSADKIYINSSQVIKKIEIVNAAGANVISKTNINLTEPVYVNMLAPGFYLVKAYAENEVLVSKFIKK